MSVGAMRKLEFRITLTTTLCHQRLIKTLEPGDVLLEPKFIPELQHNKERQLDTKTTQVLQSSPELYQITPHLVHRNLNKMASRPGRKTAIDLLLDLSEFKNKLNKAHMKLNQQFNAKKPRMKEIEYELWRTSEEVEQMQKYTDAVRTVGATLLGGLLVGLIAAPFTGGASLAAGVAAVGAGGAAGVGGAVAGVGGALGVAGANVVKMIRETDSTTAVKTLGKEFHEIFEPLKKTLKEVEQMCEKFEVKAVEYQSGNTVTNMEEFEEIFSRVSKLKEQSIEALVVTTLSTQTLENLVILLVKVLRLTATPAEDKELRDAIKWSAAQSQKVTDECEKMLNLLEKTREMLESKERELLEWVEREHRESKEREHRESKERELRESKERELRESKERELRESKERELLESKERELRESKERELLEWEKRKEMISGVVVSLVLIIIVGVGVLEYLLMFIKRLFRRTETSEDRKLKASIIPGSD